MAGRHRCSYKICLILLYNRVISDRNFSLLKDDFGEGEYGNLTSDRNLTADLF